MIRLRQRDVDAGERGLETRVRRDRASHGFADRERTSEGIGLVQWAAVGADDSKLQRSR